MAVICERAWLTPPEHPGCFTLLRSGEAVSSRKKIKANDAKLSVVILHLTELSHEASNIVLPNFEQVRSLHTHFS